MYKKAISVAIAFLALACHEHKNDKDVVAAANIAATNIWGHDVQSVTCGPCLCSESEECTRDAVVICVVTLANETGPTSVTTRFLVCKSPAQTPSCAGTTSWAEQHGNLSK